jgi:hypothetical protein
VGNDRPTIHLSNEKRTSRRSSRKCLGTLPREGGAARVAWANVVSSFGLPCLEETFFPNRMRGRRRRDVPTLNGIPTSARSQRQTDLGTRTCLTQSRRVSSEHGREQSNPRFGRDASWRLGGRSAEASFQRAGADRPPNRQPTEGRTGERRAIGGWRFSRSEESSTNVAKTVSHRGHWGKRKIVGGGSRFRSGFGCR